MKNVLSQAVAAAVISLAAHSSHAVLNPSEGVHCPSGTTSEFSSGVLKCRKVETQATAAICPLLTPEYQIRTGAADFCIRKGVLIQAYWTGDTIVEVSGQIARVIPAASLLGDNQGWTLNRDGAGNGHDRFTRTKVTYSFPVNEIYVGNPANGVHCPSGYTAHFNDGVLKCTDKERRPADCFIGSFLDINSGEDRCLGLNIDNKTLPQGEVSRSGWSLDINGSTGSRDAWTRTKYAYPKA
jgi:hypothetical protein